MIDKIPGVEEEINFLGTPPFPVPDKKSVDSLLIQPPEGKKPHIKPIEVGGGSQWPSKPSMSTPVRGTGGTRGQLPGKPTKGVPPTGRGESNGNQGGQTPPRPPPKNDEEGGRNGNGDDGGGEDDDNDGDDDDDDEEDTESVTENEEVEEQTAPGGRGVSA